MKMFKQEGLRVLLLLLLSVVFLSSTSARKHGRGSVSSLKQKRLRKHRRKHKNKVGTPALCQVPSGEFNGNEDHDERICTNHITDSGRERPCVWCKKDGSNSICSSDRLQCEQQGYYTVTLAEEADESNQASGLEEVNVKKVGDSKDEQGRVEVTGTCVIKDKDGQERTDTFKIRVKLDMLDMDGSAELRAESLAKYQMDYTSMAAAVSLKVAAKYKLEGKYIHAKFKSEARVFATAKAGILEGIQGKIGAEASVKGKAGCRYFGASGGLSAGASASGGVSWNGGNIKVGAGLTALVGGEFEISLNVAAIGEDAVDGVVSLGGAIGQGVVGTVKGTATVGGWLIGKDWIW